MEKKMSIYDYAYRDVWDSNFTYGNGSILSANFTNSIDTSIISEICAKFSGLYHDAMSVFTEESNEEELSRAREELQKHYIVSPIVWMPNYKNNFITDFRKANHLIGFCVAAWERINHKPDESIVERIMTDIIEYESTRVFANTGELVELLTVRNKAIENGIYCGSIISNSEEDFEHTYFMDVNLSSTKDVLDDCHNADDAARRLTDQYGLEYVPEKHMLMQYSDDISVFECKVPKLMWDVKKKMSRFASVSGVNYITMDSDDYEPLSGDILYFSFGTSNVDMKYRCVDVFDMNFFMF